MYVARGHVFAVCSAMRAKKSMAGPYRGCGTNAFKRQVTSLVHTLLPPIVKAEIFKLCSFWESPANNGEKGFGRSNGGRRRLLGFSEAVLLVVVIVGMNNPTFAT